MPNTSILVDLPQHLGLIFAVGKDRKTGKYPHVLLSRPSGGQSPCGWVPFSKKDSFPAEILWEDDIVPDIKEVQEAVRTGKISDEALRKLAKSKTGITMFYSRFEQRKIHVLHWVSLIFFERNLFFILIDCRIQMLLLPLPLYFMTNVLMTVLLWHV